MTHPGSVGCCHDPVVSLALLVSMEMHKKLMIDKKESDAPPPPPPPSSSIRPFLLVQQSGQPRTQSSFCIREPQSTGGQSWGKWKAEGQSITTEGIREVKTPWTGGLLFAQMRPIPVIGDGKCTKGGRKPGANTQPKVLMSCLVGCFATTVTGPYVPTCSY